MKYLFQRKRKLAGESLEELEDKNTIMNHKKITPIMKKYNMIAQVRRSNPYKPMAKATKEQWW